MAELALACKAAIAVLLVAAGGAKIADLAGFAATVRLFVPGFLSGFLPVRTARALPRVVAASIAVAECAIGAASLSSPLAGWLNLVVLALCGGFVVVAVIGYLRHPGRACRCFGALSGRAFNLAAIGRAALIAAAAVIATTLVSGPLLRLGAAGRLGLLAGAALIAWCAYTAASTIGAGRDAQPGWLP
jgi:hypothetical protein